MADNQAPGLPLLRLMQLCSVNLPVGAYAFSQGLETAVDQSWLRDLDDTFDWLREQLNQSIARCDLPVLRRQLYALQANDLEQYCHWNEFVLACRESSELRLTDSATGKALIRVLRGLDVDLNGDGPDFSAITKNDISFVSAFALAANHWHISDEDACLGYSWAWLENQVAAATKLVPLGQTQSQQLLQKLQPHLVAAVEQSRQCADQDIGASMPALAIASCWHEQQYSRLFRS